MTALTLVITTSLAPSKEGASHWIDMESDEPRLYRIRTTRYAQYPVTTLYCRDHFFVIQCIGEWDEAKATERVVALYERKAQEMKWK